MPEEKIARICWNDKHWNVPSGRNGKCGNKDSYEYQEGYGHEEWNFNTDRVVDGWVYGFLQQFNNITALHVGKIYNISFYTIERVNSIINKRWWIGKINNVEVVSTDTSKSIFKIYEKHGWIASMEADLKKQNLDSKKLRETPKGSFFNMRYRINEIELLDEPLVLEKTDPAISSFYYKLLPKTVDPLLDRTAAHIFCFKSGHNPGKHSATAVSPGGKKEKSLFHNEVQTKIFNLLEKQYGEKNVGTENELGYQTKVDIVVKLNDSFTFYEIKTASTVKAAIREAMGQILEYAYWPDRIHANKLIIISTQKATSDCKTYIKRFRKVHNIPLYLQEYDAINNILKSPL